jgi:hypothetical protein
VLLRGVGRDVDAQRELLAVGQLTQAVAVGVLDPELVQQRLGLL